MAYCRTTPPIRAINDLSFSVGEGEVFALLGPNGSGKTTTFNMFANLTTPDQGKVTVLGMSPGLPQYFSEISFVSGETQFLWTLTAQQILSFYSQLRSVNRRRMEELVEEFSFGSLLKRRWSQLSSGEKMKLRLLKALLGAPRVLFLDEPTVGLDPDAADQLRSALKQLTKEGSTIVLTSHLMRDVEELADRILFLKEGCAICEGPPSDFVETSSMLDVRLSACPAEIPPFLTPLSHGYFRLHIADLGQLISIAEIKEVRSTDGGLEEFFIAKAREKIVVRPKI